MKQEQKKQLSALIDNEESEAVMLRVSHALSRDEDLRATLIRYQLISDSMRGEDINIRSLDVVTAVSQKLETEPTVLAPEPSPGNWRRWVQPAVGAALAASVAAFGIMLAPQFLGKQGEGAVPSASGYRVVAQPIGPVENAMARPSGASGQWKTLADDKTINRRMRSYLERHSQYAAPGGVQGVMPYTSFVSYDGR